MAEPKATTLFERVQRLPPTLRPIVIGPVILAYAILAKGGIILIPAFVIYVIAGGDAVSVLKQAGIVFGLALAGAVGGGLTYGLAGRHLKKIPAIGRPLAGIVAIAPYVASAVGIVLWEDSGNPFRPWGDEHWFMWTLLTLLFGVVIGLSWFEKE